MSETTVVLDTSGALSAALAQALAVAGYDAAVALPGDATVMTPPDGNSASALRDLAESGNPFGEAQTELLAHGWRVPVVILTRVERGRSSDSAAPLEVARPALIDVQPSVLSKDDGVDHGLFARYARLTRREQQVATLVVRGMLNKQISAELGVAERTVKIHRARAMEKLGVRCLPDFVRCIDRVSAATGAVPISEAGPRRRHVRSSLS